MAWAGVASRLATERDVAGFRSVTELTIVAAAIIGSVDDQVVGFVTAVNRTVYSVIEDRYCSRLAVVNRITGLSAVTIEPVITACVIGDVIAVVGPFVTRIGSAGNRIIAVDRRPCLTGARLTGFHTAAEKPVVTISVYCAPGATRIGEGVRPYGDDIGDRHFVEPEALSMVPPIGSITYIEVNSPAGVGC